jgi:hypothetical protein
MKEENWAVQAQGSTILWFSDGAVRTALSPSGYGLCLTGTVTVCSTDGVPPRLLMFNSYIFTRTEVIEVNFIISKGY